ncbi:N-acetylmuramoyl-L-alanine amidase [Pseudodesulfovibrio piezophilus]|uniref:N-acetylmuramoyl-L-alanine amidase n=1 Tax=Pseudodesulfovibrio piezophilus (strain DSM 21447 / JCM 15486 / C1TLV30) TaxID=1322246 RepID=M1WWY9_PSEP2|nr:N-acetylmuramoyl-L-alanine amidase [Pseudodesulfovibrio piezophilus]CCH49393.1 N-acetylmuramoyl-L-alanine amidase [Pseudodesulfovibrio piezophilus C1TLV30]
MKPLYLLRHHTAPVLLLLALAALSLCATDALALSAKSYFLDGHSDFHSLLKTRTKKKYRSNWEKVERKFSRCLKADPNGSYAPKSLYYIGRVYEELGKQSGLKSDFRRAVDYFGRVEARYPRHGWADDCLYRRADIYARRLGEKGNARLDLAKIIVDFPRSDMHGKAKEYLRKLGGYEKAIAKVSGKKTKISSASASRSTRKKSSHSSGGKSITPVKDPSGLAHLDTVRFKSSDEYTRVVLELDGRVKYRYQVLAPNPAVGRPHRLYVDIQGSRLGHDVTASTEVSDGILRSIRTGQYNADTTRVVLDFLSMQEYKIFPLDNPYRIVIDVYSPEEGTVTARKAQSSTSHKVTTQNSKYRPPKGSKSQAGDLLEQLGLTVKTIMIDAGHGGKDPGAVANGLREKDLNLRFAKLLGSKLKEKGFTIHYTRTTDVFIPLEQRTAIANVKKADLFVSIHCNASRTSKAHGLETYSLNLAKSKDAVRIAARENAVDPRSISDLQFILTDLMVNSKIKESRDLASDVQSNTISRVRRKWQLKNMGTREAPFYVLMGAKMPSVLVELGYITNPTEAKRLNSKAYQEYLARGIVDGILAYKSKIERYATR